MTISYSQDVATGRGFGMNFGRLLFRWKGSIYKLVLPDLIIYMALYFSISLIYRLGFGDNLQGKIIFEKVVKHFDTASKSIPVSFVLGFYVSQIIGRWWNQFETIPGPDSFSIVIAGAIQGADERSRLLRRTIIRYVNLSSILVMTIISPQVKSRFPTLGHLVEAGIMMPHERVIIQRLQQKVEYNSYFIPLVWAGTLISKSRRENKILSDKAQSFIISKLAEWRDRLGLLLSYNWVTIPIVYSQVVTLAVYLYFITAVMGKQFIEREDAVDLYVPIFLFLEFFFYVGWLRVAEGLLNPFGEDDDDFEINWMIDRNITVSYLIVDAMHHKVPNVAKDAYWDVVVPDQIPYTDASKIFKTNHPHGRTSINGGKYFKTAGQMKTTGLNTAQATNLTRGAQQDTFDFLEGDEQGGPDVDFGGMW